MLLNFKYFRSQLTSGLHTSWNFVVTIFSNNMDWLLSTFSCIFLYNKNLRLKTKQKTYVFSFLSFLIFGSTIWRVEFVAFEKVGFTTMTGFLGIVDTRVTLSLLLPILFLHIVTKLYSLPGVNPLTCETDIMLNQKH